jgi:hypothetical protein
MISKKKQHQMKSVVVDARCLKSFFFKYLFSNSKEKKILDKALTYVPEKCNYQFDPDTFVADVTTWYQPKLTLSFHLQLNFSHGCEIQLSSTYYSSLKHLCDIQTKLLGFRRYRPPKRAVSSINFIEKFLLKLQLV